MMEKTITRQKFLVILGEKDTKTGAFVERNLADLGIEARFADSTDRFIQLRGQVQSHLIVLDSDWYQMLHTEAHPVVFWAPAPPPDRTRESLRL